MCNAATLKLFLFYEGRYDLDKLVTFDDLPEIEPEHVVIKVKKQNTNLNFYVLLYTYKLKEGRF